MCQEQSAWATKCGWIAEDSSDLVMKFMCYKNLTTFCFRIKLMIVAVWMMSFLICFPSLIGWTNWSDWSGLQTLTSKTIALLLTPTPAVQVAIP